MLAMLVDKPFDDPEWLFEIKWDGVRAVSTIESAHKVQVRSRTDKDLLVQFPEFDHLGRAFSSLPVIIDGEIVSLDRYGRSSFQRLQPRLNRRTSDPALQRAIPVTYVIFDLLYAGKRDLRSTPLDERKALLERLLQADAPHVMLSKHVIGTGTKLFAEAKRRKLEGIIAKQRTSLYVERRSRSWLKIKTHLEQEVVIAGWTEPRGSREKFGALVLGVYDKGKLRYVGHVGTGFDQELLDVVYRKLKPLETTRSPFATKPPSNAPVHWVRPHLVAEVKFGEWTKDGLMRQPVFVGLRTDKKPEDVVRE
ncbi:MAG TPA: non-homologous end-joining DNA ligase [Candidatus Eremiobacteraceae bacterium]|nr:non-homologous end-joining DNA ligase [Candidatus Eremiobacteraceae bacterium]